MYMYIELPAQIYEKVLYGIFFILAHLETIFENKLAHFHTKKCLNLFSKSEPNISLNDPKFFIPEKIRSHLLDVG
jgi:hypothetical protein